jgi:hypothetical protein
VTGATADDDGIQTLEATYARVCAERDRLRSTRGFFSRPLGPAPASAGISTAVVTTLGSHLDTGSCGRPWALVLLVLVGAAYDGKPAYRHLYTRELAGVRTSGSRFALWRHRVRHEAAAAKRAAEDDRRELADWYRTMIRRERDIVGGPLVCNRYHLAWFRSPRCRRASTWSGPACGRCRRSGSR